MDYKTSGVDIEKGKAFVEHLKIMAPKIGGFNGMYPLPKGYERPVLVSGADGVGTKMNICRIAFDYTTIGIDLVAMCVNDVITCGAKPLYFLDYISTKKVDEEVDDIMEGIIKGCELTDMQLLGGETAEHPKTTDTDLAGFCTGIVEESDIIDGSEISEGDIIIGIESNGLHSNGFSLINQMVSEGKLSVTDELLAPTHIYAPLVQELIYEVPILGMAHITGGGIQENLPRCLPEGLKVDVNYNSWNLPDIFQKIMLAGKIPEEEMKKVFNLGIGYCVIVPEHSEDATHDTIDAFEYKSWTIGKVVL